jgi:ribonucleoside-diphosphate reductase alpha chain
MSHNPIDSKEETKSEILSTFASSIKNDLKVTMEKKLTIVKRNGMIVPFNRERIQNALEAAFRDTKKIAKPKILPEELLHTIEELTQSVVEQAINLGTSGVSLTVEGIQDLVEIALMKNGFHDVARDYIIYRDQHKAMREDSIHNVKVLRKDNTTIVKFNPVKISSTIEKLFRKTQNIQGTFEEEILLTVNKMTQAVIDEALVLAKTSSPLQLHVIQDLIENTLMKNGFYDVAKDYIVHRYVAGDQTPKASKTVEDQNEERYEITGKDGQTRFLTKKELEKKIQFATRNLKEVNATEVLNETVKNFYPGIKENEIDIALIMAARVKIEKEPEYAKVAARFLLDITYREAINVGFHDKNLEETHKKHFIQYIKFGIQQDRLNEKLLTFDLDFLANHMKLERDDLFEYIGLQTLYDRYFIHHEKRRMETPQYFWMRVAMGLSWNEQDKNQKAVEFYDILSQFYFVSSTPTLFNAGTSHPQLSSCYLSTIMDDLHHIFKVIADDAQLSKWAGGIGNDWTNVRATGSRIKGTNGESQGVIPFLKVANDTAVAVNQGGKRKGAMCAYLETWHLDIEDFLELRKNTGDERRRTHDMNTANWIPDLFMKRVEQNGSWTLFSPVDTPDLHDLYGQAFEKRYEEYERLALEGKIKLHKTVDATTLWRKMLSMLFETGHPWITFKDPSNIRSPQDHVGVVHSSNLCTEILLNTSKEETAVCNLGSINLPKHIENGKLNEKLLAKTVSTAIRMLDSVIDINFYPTQEAHDSNVKHRPIGLGIMGFQDALYELEISYASHEAVQFADESMEMISFYAILASSQIAKEKGTYSSYKGSKWDRGLLPIDTIAILEQERNMPVDEDRQGKMDWSIVREHIKKHGMRNSNTMAIAPTATIANIAGVTSSIEPTYKNLYVKSNLSGEFTIPNTYLINKLKKLNIWDTDMLDDLKYYDGSILEIERIPDETKKVFLTAFEIDPEWIIAAASKRQKWIDMGQSLNLYLGEPSGKKLHQMYMTAWKKGLKTTYYLRCLAATQIEKSTMDINKRGLQPRWMKSQSASSNIKVERETKPEFQTGKVCNLGEACESCQ